MDFSMNEEQLMITKTIRDFLVKELPAESVRTFENNAQFPETVWQKMAGLGLLGLPFPEEYGGEGRPLIDQTMVVKEMAWGMTSLAHMYIMTTLFGGKAIERHGTEEQKKFFLPKIIEGKLKFAMSMTEPNAGSDVFSISTKAELQGDHYVVNGSKMFSTGAHLADYILLAVRTERGKKKHEGISYLLVDAKTPGIKVNPLEHLGLMAIQTAEVYYDEVKVPKENVLGTINQGAMQILDVLDTERIFTAAQAVGLAERAFEYALDYAKNRSQFGQPIGKFQSISHMFAEMASEIEASKYLVYYAAWMKDQKKPCSKEASMAKYKATEVAKVVALHGMQILGGYGYMNEYDMERYLREAVVGTVYGGTSQIQKNIIARELGL